MLFNRFFVVGLFLFSIFSFADANGDKKTNLEVLRGTAFKTLIFQNTNKEVVEYKNTSLGYFELLGQGGWLALFQTDNVDRSWVTFRFARESQKTTCMLYIREVPDVAQYGLEVPEGIETHYETPGILLNLLECTGPGETALGNQGQGSITVDLSDLQS